MENTTTNYIRTAHCGFKHMNAPRVTSAILTAGIVVENSLLLIAIVTHWKKFHSNLYRFVASLVCADLFFGLSNFAVVIMQTTNAGLDIVSMLKAVSYASFLVCILSMTLLNISVKSTYIRSCEIMAQAYPDRSWTEILTLISNFFRKTHQVKRMIISIWLLLPIFTLVGVMTRCTEEEHDCMDGCSTMVIDSSGEEQRLCKITSHCSSFMAPLSFPFLLLTNATSWCALGILVASTIYVVFFKVIITPKPSIDRAKPLPGIEITTTDGYKERISGKNSPAFEHTLKYEESENNTWAESSFVSRQQFGFNNDFISKFSLAVTILQFTIWSILTTVTLRSFFAQKQLLPYLYVQIYTNIFTLPSLANPWICFFTMTKLKDAVIATFFKHRCRFRKRRVTSTMAIQINSSNT
uniref:uncharacterized protein LOC120344940 n=1 Tax=Styela clava TaxID=7725 RepID=UPI001939E1E5|nr:uncharacterized protein LOC120344940 [Styela clava]